jgi:hypothetical protein
LFSGREAAADCAIRLDFAKTDGQSGSQQYRVYGIFRQFTTADELAEAEGGPVEAVVAYAGHEAAHGEDLFSERCRAVGGSGTNTIDGRRRGSDRSLP